MSIYSDILKEHWGYPDFRGIQREIIESIGSGRDTLGLMPTGGGKSITFQVPALAAEGVCVVITPLIALMKDQVANLKRRGIKAAAIYSGLSREEIVVILENCIFGAVKILYVSPERLNSQIFTDKLRHINVSFITVDEAHCISQWGYDFRPSYLHIADIRTLLPGIPVLALTATATPEVVDDIQAQLGFREKNVFRMSFGRDNLAYIVRQASDKRGELMHILSSVEGSAIVYTHSRRRTREISELLTNSGFSSTYYHAGLDDATKDERQKSWVADKTRIIVATSAFGMGIDKPDVRVVIHFDCPDSIEEYFQEAGRAGRDGNKAFAVMLYNEYDRGKLSKRIADTFPEKDTIRAIYDHLAYFFQIGVGSGYDSSFTFDIGTFCHTYKHFPIQVNSALKILTRAGYIDYAEERDNSARVRFLVGRDDLYRLENNTPDEDKVIVTLLRNYGGLFSDYGFIDENFISSQSGLAKHTVHHALVELGKKHIVKFIPASRTPAIRYTQRREESRLLQFPKHVYDERKSQFTARIASILHYATCSNRCRSRLLLEYFGEKKSDKCGHCDVCIAEKKTTSPGKEGKAAIQAILQLLNDGNLHGRHDFENLNLAKEDFEYAIRRLLREDIIAQQDGLIYKL